jgi:hypothetical protein
LREQATDRLGESAWFAFDLLPGAARDAPARQLEALLSPPVVLEGRVGVMKTTAVCFDDQPSISPEEIRLEEAVPHVKRDVDLGSRQPCARAHAQEQSLQLTAGSLGCGVELIEN